MRKITKREAHVLDRLLDSGQGLIELSKAKEAELWEELRDYLDGVEVDMQEYSVAHARFRAMRDELAGQYPDQWVAVAIQNGQIICADETQTGLLFQTDALGYKRHSILTEFLNTEEVKWVL